MAILNEPCAAYLGTPEATLISVNNCPMDAHEFLKIKRLNQLIGFELGLLIASTNTSKFEAYRALIKVLSDRLLIKLPQRTIKEIVGTTFKAVKEQSDIPHWHLSRCELEEGFPQNSFVVIADVEQFILINIVAKLLQENDDISPLVLCFTEALTALLLLESHTYDSLLAVLEMPTEFYQDNVISLT